MELNSYSALWLFMRALTHKVRTPLHIVSSELYHIKDLVGEELCALALAKIEEINKTLSESRPPGESPLSPTRVSVSQLAEELGFKGTYPAAYLMLDLPRFSVACRLVPELLEILGGSAPVDMRFSFTDGHCALTWSSKKETPNNSPTNTLKTFSSFSDAINFDRNEDSCRSVIADAIFLLHDTLVSITDGDSIKAHVSVPEAK